MGYHTNEFMIRILRWDGKRRGGRVLFAELERIETPRPSPGSVRRKEIRSKRIPVIYCADLVTFPRISFTE